MTPRVVPRTPSRGGTSFQKFRADSLELAWFNDLYRRGLLEGEPPLP
jgi:hypothetical protein